MQNRATVSILFLVPTFLFLAVFVFYPIADTIYMSFLAKGSGPFVGFQNYDYVLFRKIYPLIDINNLASRIFPMGAVIHNILVVVIHLPLTVFFGLLLAVLLRDVKGGAIIKSIVFLGMIVPMVIGGVLLRFIYDVDAGVVNGFLRLIRLGSYARGWTFDPQTALLSVILGSVWIWTGFSMVVYSAGLEGIPDELYEAAKIDGASKWTIFWRITVPMLKSTTLVVVTMTLLWELKLFDIVYVATNGFASRVLSFEVYLEAFTFPPAPDLGRASAIATILTIMTFGVAAYLVNRMGKS